MGAKQLSHLVHNPSGMRSRATVGARVVYFSFLNHAIVGNPWGETVCSVTRCGTQARSRGVRIRPNLYPPRARNNQNRSGVQPRNGMEQSAIQPNENWTFSAAMRYEAVVMSSTTNLPVTILDRMERAVDRVRDRLLRAKSALEAEGIPYAVIGGNAVAAWVSSVDSGAVRNTNDVDILLAKENLPAARVAMAKAGFVYRHAAGTDFFQDGEGARFSDSVHLVFAGEKVRPEYACAAPEIEETDTPSSVAFRVLTLEALVRMKLTSYRLKDRVHLQDLLGVGLLDESWMDKVPPVLRERMREVLDNPDA